MTTKKRQEVSGEVRMLHGFCDRGEERRAACDSGTRLQPVVHLVPLATANISVKSLEVAPDSNHFPIGDLVDYNWARIARVL